MITEISEPTLEEKTAHIIVKKLSALGVKGIKIDSALVGPVVTAYPIQLSASTPLEKLLNKAENIALACHVSTVDIQRVDGNVVVFVPNKNRKTVEFKDSLFWYLKDEKVKEMTLPILLGQDFEGNNAVIDLAIQPHILIAGSTGSGKAQPLNETVIIPSGKTMIGKLKVGDSVIGSNGKATKVIGVFPQGKKEIVRLFFSDKTSVTCCLDHLWKVQCRKNRILSNNVWEVLSTREIINNLRSDTRNNNYRNYSIPILSNSVEFEETEVDIDPYLLGLLLGDGSFCNNTPILTTADTFILEETKKRIPKNMEVTYAGKYGYRIKNINISKIKPNILRLKLIDLNLTKRTTFTKFIPKGYKYNSFEVRLAILRGLMDTDGTVDQSGKRIVFNSSSKSLADDVIFIVQSLGGTARITGKIPEFLYKGRMRTGARHYNVSICLPTGINPFLLPRKADLVQARTKYFPSRYIDKVEFLGLQEAVCISVAAKDNLYLTKNCIITHNSIFESAIIAALATLKSPKELELYLVDTKRVDLGLFESWPHVKQTAKSAEDWYIVINEIYLEVQKRNRLFEQQKVRNITEYNKLLPEDETKLPHIVLIIDELADLMEKDNDIRVEKKRNKEEPETKVEDSLRKLIQICRAAGVHIIACTQRTSVDIISGTIKANFPTRISLRLPQSNDSRVILGQNGAENLLGLGDMLVKKADSDQLLRYHGPFVKLSDIEAIPAQYELLRESLGLIG